MANPILLKITNAGLQAMAAAIASGATNVVLSHYAVGRANGTGYTPTGEETALVEEILRVPIIGGRVLNNQTLSGPYAEFATSFTPTSDFPVYECGLFSSDGVLVAVQSRPQTAYLIAQQGIQTVMALTFSLHGASNVVFPQNMPGSPINIMFGDEGVVSFMAVNGEVATPPASPPLHAVYLVGADATGVFAGHENNLAVRRDTGWVYKNAPLGSIVRLANGAYKERTATGWAAYVFGITAAQVATATEAILVQVQQNAASIIANAQADAVEATNTIANDTAFGSRITNLETAMPNKAAAIHTHPISSIDALQATLDDKSLLAHTHAIADVANLQVALNAKITQAQGDARYVGRNGGLGEIRFWPDKQENLYNIPATTGWPGGWQIIFSYTAAAIDLVYASPASFCALRRYL